MAHLSPGDERQVPKEKRKLSRRRAAAVASWTEGTARSPARSGLERHELSGNMKGIHLSLHADLNLLMHSCGCVTVLMQIAVLMMAHSCNVRLHGALEPACMNAYPEHIALSLSFTLLYDYKLLVANVLLSPTCLSTMNCIYEKFLLFVIL